MIELIAFICKHEASRGALWKTAQQDATIAFWGTIWRGWKWTWRVWLSGIVFSKLSLSSFQLFLGQELTLSLIEFFFYGSYYYPGDSEDSVWDERPPGPTTSLGLGKLLCSKLGCGSRVAQELLWKSLQRGGSGQDAGLRGLGQGAGLEDQQHTLRGLARGCHEVLIRQETGLGGTASRYIDLGIELLFFSTSLAMMMMSWRQLYISDFSPFWLENRPNQRAVFGGFHTGVNTNLWWFSTWWHIRLS